MVVKTELKPYKIHRFGWLPDLPDARDHMYAAPMATMVALPAKVDLRPHCPPVYDQGQLGSCTGNAIAGAVQFDREKQKLKPDFVPSRLFIYYNERVIEGTVESDSGAQIRDGIKSVAKHGVPPETDWPPRPAAAPSASSSRRRRIAAQPWSTSRGRPANSGPSRCSSLRSARHTAQVFKCAATRARSSASRRPVRYQGSSSCASRCLSPGNRMMLLMTSEPIRQLAGQLAS